MLLLLLLFFSFFYSTPSIIIIIIFCFFFHFVSLGKNLTDLFKVENIVKIKWINIQSGMKEDKMRKQLEHIIDLCRKVQSISNDYQ